MGAVGLAAPSSALWKTLSCTLPTMGADLREEVPEPSKGCIHSCGSPPCACGGLGRLILVSEQLQAFECQAEVSLTIQVASSYLSIILANNNRSI